MQMRADLEEPLVVRNGPVGTRRILYAKQGTFSGAKLRGELLPGGGDWVLRRQDGIAELDIRFMLRTDDEQLIYVTCDGILDITPEMRERIRAGGEVPPSHYYFRTRWRRWLSKVGFRPKADIADRGRETGRGY